MKLKTLMYTYIPWFVITCCALNVILTWGKHSENIAWVIATVGWLMYKTERD